MDNEYWTITMHFASGGYEVRECDALYKIGDVLISMRDACADDGDIVKIEIV